MAKARKPKPSHSAAQAAQTARAVSRSAAHVNMGFEHFAQRTAQISGRPYTFLIAFGMIVLWGVTGPLFHYSDTWQLVINTSTTIITFLMVFLIQNTQNRDTLALQIKLAELIFVIKGARNDLAAAENLSDQDLEALHKLYCAGADHTLRSLHLRRAAGSREPKSKNGGSEHGAK
jgi:low affinity Fe/Cu permease